MSETVRFAHPPVVELIIGLQFSPLSRMTTAHLGWFWKELGEEWPDLVDGPALPDQFERFALADRRRSPSNPAWRIGQSFARNRVSINHYHRDRLLQAQSSQFRFHWRKSHEQYPGYDRLIGEFGKLFGHFARFIESDKLGQILLNQWDLTYVNAFPRGEDWRDPGDWRDILPGLFGLPPVADGLILDTRSANWSYVIAPELGRLHIAAGMQMLPDEPRDALLIRSTARGPVRNDAARFPAIQEQFDLGHDAILKTFLQTTATQIQAKWERIS